MPQGAVNPWNLISSILKDGIQFFMENPGMGLKAAYRQVLKVDGTPSHCQMVLEHKGGVIAVCTTADFSKIGFLPEAVRIQGVFDEFPRGFKNVEPLGGIETSEEALLREMAEKNEANVHIRRFLSLAKSVNVDNALIEHPVTGDGNDRTAGGNDFYLVIFPNEDLESTDGSTWTIKPTVTVDKKMSGMVFVEMDDFNPLEHYGFGIDGFALTGWLLFKNWMHKNMPPKTPSVDQALEQLRLA
ncbi:MAG: hypothetical protein WC503_04625, partial [Candidatus Shapirobacteria bacterium]